VSVPDGLIAGRYRLVNLVGSGGMGDVWEAWDERLQRRVAAKLLRLPPGLSEGEAELANQRALREARITARLHHRHAVSVFDVVDDDGRPCLIMQFLPSITLAAFLQEGGPLEPQETAQMGAQVASALTAAHELGIVHRDVKPGNILIADDGNALISDFGISRALDDTTLTATGMVHGTPAYLSPEVARGEDATFASDVFCLGATMYAALEGAPPFGTDQNSIALLHRVAAGRFEPPRQSGPLTPVLLQMLSPEPSARPSMKTVAGILDELASSGTAGEAAAPGVLTKPLATPTTQLATPASAAAAGIPAEAAAAAASPGGQNQALSAADNSPVVVRPLLPVAGAVGSGPSSNGEAGSAPPAGRRRRTARGAVIVAALVAAGTLIALVVPKWGGPGPGTVAQPPGTTTTSAPPAPSTTRQPTSSASSAESGPTSGSSQPRSSAPTQPSRSSQPRSSAPTQPSHTSQPRSSAPTQPSHTSQPRSSAPTQPSSATTTRTRPPAGNSATTAQLTEAITSYYALMPGNTGQAWPRMTASYQTNHAGGRRAYERFWGQIGRVKAGNVTGTLPGRAEATITYYYKDGRVVVERTSYQLVDEGGTLKINDSTVLSSSTQ